MENKLSSSIIGNDIYLIIKDGSVIAQSSNLEYIKNKFSDDRFEIIKNETGNPIPNGSHYNPKNKKFIIDEIKDDSYRGGSLDTLNNVNNDKRVDKSKYNDIITHYNSIIRRNIKYNENDINLKYLNVDLISTICDSFKKYGNVEAKINIPNIGEFSSIIDLERFIKMYNNFKMKNIVALYTLISNNVEDFKNSSLWQIDFDNNLIGDE